MHNNGESISKILLFVSVVTDTLLQFMIFVLYSVLFFVFIQNPLNFIHGYLLQPLFCSSTSHFITFVQSLHVFRPQLHLFSLAHFTD